MCLFNQSITELISSHIATLANCFAHDKKMLFPHGLKSMYIPSYRSLPRNRFFCCVCGVYVRHQILASQGNTLASCNKLHVPWLGPKKNQVVCVPSNYITLANMKQIVRKIWSCGHSEINVRNGRLHVVVSVLLKVI